MNPAEKTDVSKADPVTRDGASFPGELLYERSRRILFLCFFAIFILTAHQHLFAGQQRSKLKLIVLMCLAPIVIGSGLGGAAGWWIMRRARAFKRPETGEKVKPAVKVKQRRPVAKREKRKERRDGRDLLPWQRRDRQ